MDIFCRILISQQYGQILIIKVFDADSNPIIELNTSDSSGILTAELSFDAGALGPKVEKKTAQNIAIKLQNAVFNAMTVEQAESLLFDQITQTSKLH